jgi:hypothetical protein
MRDAQRRTSEMVLRMRAFGQERTANFPAQSYGAQLFAELNDIAAELMQHAKTQTSKRSAARQGTTSKSAALAAIIEDVEAMSRTARAIAITNPGVAELFRLPRGSNAQVWLSTAHAFATDAVAYKDEFIKFGLPADFIEDLTADIAAYEAAETEQSHSTGAHVAATQAIDTVLERALTLKRQLDAVVRNTYRNDPAALAAWLSATHIERPPKRRQKATKPTDAPAK